VSVRFVGHPANLTAHSGLGISWFMSADFVHLHVHSEFSLVDGVARIGPLVEAVAENDMPAVALTDQSNLFALVRFYRAAMGAGLKPICGIDLLLRNREDDRQPFRMVLLVQSDIGYRKLTELVSRSYREGQHAGHPMVEPAWLSAATCEDLIALSGARDGDVGRALLADNRPLAGQRLQHWRSVFGNRYYLQLVRTGREREENCLHASVELAARFDVPVVATNAVVFLGPKEFAAHEVRVSIHEGRTLDDPRRSRHYSGQQYLRTPAEMAELLSDIPEAVENTVEIAKRCNLELTLGKSFLPNFPVPEGMDIKQLLAEQSRKGLEQRLAAGFDCAAESFGEQRKPYDERLQVELDVINGMGFAGYFLIVADFIRWAREQRIPVGAGRGSGAGSVVAWALGRASIRAVQAATWGGGVISIRGRNSTNGM